MKENLWVLLIACACDLCLGDPVYRLHPVRLIGHLISLVESVLEKWRLLTIMGGFFLLIVVQAMISGSYLALHFLLFDWVLLLNIFLLYSCVSVQDLLKHGQRVLKPLAEDDLSKARNAVQMLIGRDAKILDKHGVARATVESLAENFIDGFLAPLFWFVLGAILAEKMSVLPTAGGLLLTLFYKVTNTLDSMVGYKNERYLAFGRFSAKLDDFLNYLPARMGIPIISVAALICGFDWKRAWLVGWRDCLKHSSPNAAHAEACVAGALNIRLNGPGIYPHGLVEKPWLGDGTAEVSAFHLKQTSKLILCSALITIMLCALLLVLN